MSAQGYLRIRIELLGRKRPSGISWVLLALVVLPGCFPPALSGPPAAGPLEVNYSHPVEEDVTDYEYFSGRMEGSQSVEIRARVNGYLSKIFPELQPGHFITKDTPLFEIDARPYQATYDVAEAEVLRAEVLFKRLTADYERQRPLVQARTTTAEEFDKVISDRNEAQAAYQAAKAALEKARLDLEFTRIKSPIDGIVSRELVTVGNLVTADQTLLTTVIQPDPIYVYYDIDENVVHRIIELIHQGKFKSARVDKIPIDMKVGNGEEYDRAGLVNFVDNRLDPNTGTIRIRAEFQNPRLANGANEFTSGMFARVRMALGPTYRGILVSERAIGNNLDQKIVYVLDSDQKVAMRNVRLGAAQHGMRVVLDGLSLDDRVIVSNLLRLRPGIQVVPHEVPMPRRE